MNNKKLKIAFICDNFPAVSETFIRTQIDYFIKQKHHVDIFSVGHLIENDFLSKYNNCFGLKSNLQKLYLFPLLFIRLFLKKPILAWKTLNFFKYGKQVYYLKIFYVVNFFLERNINYDILMCHFGGLGLVGSFIKKNLLPQAKLFCMFHGGDIREGIKKGGKIYKELDLQADAVLSISSYNRKFLESWIKNKKRIIDHPTGVDVKKFSAGSKGKTGRNGYRLLSVGRLVKEKGYFYGLEAVKKLIESRPDENIVYDIVGEGELRDAMSKWITEKGLGGKVILHGAKTGKKVVKFYQNCDIFILSSVAEAAPVVLMEAQSCGIPVVATDVGGVKDLIVDGKTGFIVEPKNSDKIFEKLKWLFKHRGKWELMGKEGRSFIKNNYNSKTLNERLEELFYK
jgi:colanic acid/amylovoran biosynthesis glycosyltransferase